MTLNRSDWRLWSRARGFTLVELLLAMTILSVLMVLLLQMVDGISRSWKDGEKRIENFQNGRAILDLISRELSPAVISEAHQLIQNPFTDSQRSTTIPSLAPNSDSIFWQSPVARSANGDMGEIGYYLTRDSSAGPTGSYQLKRFFVPPGHPKFLIFTTSYTPTATAARWVASASTTTFTATEFESVSSVVSDGVLGLWVRCIDVNGEPIPWFNTNSPEASSTSNTKFNSAARFEPAVIGTPGGSRAGWPYTSETSPAATFQANRLPSAIELTIITVDSSTLQRQPIVPELPAVATPADVPGAITTFLNESLTAAPSRITSARLFSTCVRLDNGTQ